LIKLIEVIKYRINQGETIYTYALDDDGKLRSERTTNVGIGEGYHEFFWQCK